MPPEALRQYVLGRDLYFGQDLDGALRVLLRAGDAAPGFSAATFLTGKIYYFQEDTLRAEEWWKKTLARNPHHLDSLKWLARLYLAQDRAAEAEPLVTRALADDSEDPELLILLGRIRRGQNDLARALELFTRAGRFSERLAEASIHLAEIYRSYGMGERAAAELEQALVLLGPDSPLSPAVRTALHGLETGGTP